VQCKRGPSVLQPYRDLRKLLRKGSATSDQVSWIFHGAPLAAFAWYLTVSAIVPIITDEPLPLALLADLIGGAFVLSLASFAISLAAFDTASPFGGLGASRWLGSFAEPALILVFFTVGALSRSDNPYLENHALASSGAAYVLPRGSRRRSGSAAPGSRATRLFRRGGQQRSWVCCHARYRAHGRESDLRHGVEQKPAAVSASPNVAKPRERIECRGTDVGKRRPRAAFEANRRHARRRAPRVPEPRRVAASIGDHRAPRRPVAGGVAKARPRAREAVDTRAVGVDEAVDAAAAPRATRSAPRNPSACSP